MHKRYLYSLPAVFILFSLLISGCSASEYPVHLMMSNSHHRTPDPVHVRVKIYEINEQHKDLLKDLFDELIYYEEGHGLKSFNLNLPEGKYRITAESDNGNAGLDVVFDVDRTLWLFLTYWGENHLQFYISPLPSVWIKE